MLYNITYITHYHTHTHTLSHTHTHTHTIHTLFACSKMFFHNIVDSHIVWRSVWHVFGKSQLELFPISHLINKILAKYNISFSFWSISCIITANKKMKSKKNRRILKLFLEKFGIQDLMLFSQVNLCYYSHTLDANIRQKYLSNDTFYERTLFIQMDQL